NRRCEEHEREDDLDRQYQASTYRERPKVDKLRITLSTFTGSDPDAWLHRAVQYFELNETDGPDRVRYAAYYLDGEANVWWQWLTRINRKRQQIITWDVFERESRLEGPSTWRYARARKKVVRKRTTIERKKGRIRQGREYAHWRRRAWRLEIRRKGAQGEDVGRLMRTRDCSKWTSAHRALDDARTVLGARRHAVGERSAGALSGTRGPVDRRGNRAGLSSVGSSRAVDKDAREQGNQMGERTMGSEWCASAQSLGRVGTGEGETAHGRAACAVGDACEMGEDLGLVGLGKLGDRHGIVTRAKGGIACAPKGRGKTKAASLVLIGIGMARILDPAGLGKEVECRDAREGSVTRLKLPTTKIEPFEVRVANGERLQCTESFRKMPIKFQGVTVKADLYALPLVGPDVVLGVQWLEGLGKVTTDYRTGIMEFNSEGRLVTLSTGTEKGTKEVGLKSIERVWHGGGQIFAV
ncbi:Unknown protein, partial [Striga hermonthica]